MTNLSVRDFANLVATDVREILGKNFTVTVHEVLKNNSIKYTGIQIRKEDAILAPTIYVDSMYAEYSEMKMTLVEVVDNVLCSYNSSEAERILDFSLSDKETIRNNITFTLVNADMNKELLEQVPYLKVLDYAIVFRVISHVDSEGMASIRMTNDYMKACDLDMQELTRLANANTRKFHKSYLSPIEEVIKVNSDGYCPTSQGSLSLHVLSNTMKLNGATTILLPEVREQLLNLFSEDARLIPSSVHEWIIMNAPVATAYDEFGQLDTLISEVNQTHVAQEDILGWHAYTLKELTDAIDLAIQEAVTSIKHTEV